MFSYFESSVDGIIPNEYSSLENICSDMFSYIVCLKDCCMLTARRVWVANNHLLTPEFPKKILRLRFDKKNSEDDSNVPTPTGNNSVADLSNSSTDTATETTAISSAVAPTSSRSSNINNSNLLNNLNNNKNNSYLNNRIQGSGRPWLVTNEIRDELLKLDNNLVNSNTKEQFHTKKEN